MLQQGKPAACVFLSEFQAFARLDTGDEEAIAAGLLRTATELCEAYIGSALMMRTFTEEVAFRGDTQRLTIVPVRAITSVRPSGATDALQPGQFEVEMDSDGCAKLRLDRSDAHVVVAGEAGMTDDPNHVPEPLRQGILHMAASMFANRDSGMQAIPPIVTALWRPYKRLGLAR